MTADRISDQFQGLPMGSLIGGPLTAACDAQMQLANSTATFINTVGFERRRPDSEGFSRLRNVKFAFDRPTEIRNAEGAAAPVALGTEQVSLTVPLLAITPIPNLQVDNVDVTFDMEVKSSEQHKDSSEKELAVDASITGGIGPFSVKVQVNGKVATRQENTRSSDNSAKYHVAVRASNHGMPEGLSRVFDIMATAIAPVTQPKPDSPFPRAIPSPASTDSSAPADQEAPAGQGSSVV